MMTLSGYGLYAKDAVKVVDRANPEAVAKAFINALINKKLVEAASYVIEKDRDDFKKELKRGVPPLPAKPEIIVSVKKNGIQADVSVKNAVSLPGKPDQAPFGLDMELHDGKWWIVK